MLVVIEYAWPPKAYEIEAFFEDEIKKGEIATCYPKILALKNDLKFTRQPKDQVPKGSIEITLPIPFQTTANTITRGRKTRKDVSQAILVKNYSPLNQLHSKTRRRKNFVQNIRCFIPFLIPSYLQSTCSFVHL
jgi:hypothetical protein